MNKDVAIGAKGTQYENWMSMSAIKLVGGLTAALAAAFILLCIFADGVSAKLIVGILLIAFAWLFIDILRIRKALSYTGGKTMDFMQKRLLEKLAWDGVGQALDVGCGSGTMTIRLAKAFPQAKITGIDYWGMGWDYSKTLCEKNAELEGVGESCTFQKGDAANLDFADETFDALTANCVYSQIMGKAGMKELIAESLRTLKKGAPFAIQDYFEREKRFGSISELISALKEQGISEVQYEGGLDKELPKVVIRPYCINGTGILWGRK